jgi:hypothetical protein
MKEIKYTRTFTGKDGQERKEYILVGYLFEKDGRQSILLKNYINPAALANEKGEVWLNVYEHKQKSTETQKTPNKTESVTEPTVAEVSKVVNEGKGYAEKWKELSEGNNDIISDDVPF